MTTDITDEMVERASNAYTETRSVERRSNGGFVFHKGLPVAMRAALEAALSTLPAAAPHGVVEGWQTIETAPKDGTWILGFETGINTKYTPHEVMRWRDVGRSRTTMTGEGWFNSAIRGVAEPSHWMPLPPPPGASAAPQPAPAAGREAVLETISGALLSIRAENDRARRESTNVSNNVIDGQLLIAFIAIRALVSNPALAGEEGRNAFTSAQSLEDGKC